MSHAASHALLVGLAAGLLFELGWLLSYAFFRRRNRINGVRVQILDISPDDMIVLTTDDDLTQQQANHLRDSWRAATQSPNRVVVLPKMTVSVIRGAEK